MKKNPIGWRSRCPVARTLDLVGDRWTLLVVRDLVRGKKHFDEFLRSPEGIASNILAQRLNLLVEAGLVSREKDEADRRRQVYALTESGENLRRLLHFVAGWGMRQFPGSERMIAAGEGGAKGGKGAR